MFETKPKQRTINRGCRYRTTFANKLFTCNKYVDKKKAYHGVNSKSITDKNLKKDIFACSI